MKKLILLCILIVTISACRSKEESQILEDKSKVTSIKSTATIENNEYSDIRINSIIHENKQYIVAIYRDGICIIPDNNFNNLMDYQISYDFINNKEKEFSLYDNGKLIGKFKCEGSLHKLLEGHLEE